MAESRHYSPTRQCGADDRNESEFASALEQGFRAAGWKAALIKGIEARQAQRKTGYSSATVIGGLYAELGDKDQAFQWLDTAYRERDYWLIGLRTNFLFDPLRSDPRFAEMTRRVGLNKRIGSSGRTRTYNPPVNSRMLCH